MATAALRNVAMEYGVWTQIAKVADVVGLNINEVARVPVRVSARFKSRSFGNARWKTNRSTGQTHSYNIGIAAFLEPHRDAFINTLTHEAAHIIDVMMRGTSDHGADWRRLHRAMGGDGRARSRMPAGLDLSAQKKVVAICARCDAKLRRTRRLQRGAVYTHQGCGGMFMTA